MNRLSTGQKVLLGGGIVYLIVLLLLDWFDAAGEFGALLGVDTGVNGFSGGLGVLSGFLTIALLVWEGLGLAGVNVQMGTTSPALIGAILAGLAAIFGILNVLTNLSFAVIGAWIGVIVALGLLYGAYVRFQESKLGTTGPVV